MASFRDGVATVCATPDESVKVTTYSPRSSSFIIVFSFLSRCFQLPLQGLGLLVHRSAVVDARRHCDRGVAENSLRLTRLAATGHEHRRHRVTNAVRPSAAPPQSCPPTAPAPSVCRICCASEQSLDAGIQRGI